MSRFGKYDQAHGLSGGNPTGPSLKFVHSSLPILSSSRSLMGILISVLCIIFPTLMTGLIVFILVHGKRRHFPGCKLLGVEANNSNISDQYDERYSKGESSDNTEAWKVKSLWVFPVKSCRGIELQHGKVIKTGMAYDRQFALAQLLKITDKSDPPKVEDQWKFMTQRERPQMARVRTEIWIPDPSSPKYSPEECFVESQGYITLLFPIEKGFWGLVSRLIIRLGRTGLEHHFYLPWNPSPAQIEKFGYTSKKMAIWKENPDSLQMMSTLVQYNNSILEDLRKFLDIPNPLAIFRVPEDPVRNLYRCAPKKEDLGYQAQVGFQDSYPLHIMNLASVHNLSSRLAPGTSPLNVLRFRPNIIITGPQTYDEDDWKIIKTRKKFRVTGPQAYDEDEWKSIKFGRESQYFVCSRTSRCKLPNVDPITGLKDAVEPDKMMRSFRTIDAGAPNKACLGMQMVPASEESEISVGDTIEVLKRGEHFLLKE